jgi:hypothetical protein
VCFFLLVTQDLRKFFPDAGAWLSLGRGLGYAWLILAIYCCLLLLLHAVIKHGSQDLSCGGIVVKSFWQGNLGKFHHPGGLFGTLGGGGDGFVDLVGCDFAGAALTLTA